MSEKHLFPGKSVNAVIACKVICTSFTEQMNELSKIRTNWTPAYASGLASRVDTLAASYLGVNTRDQLFNATAVLNNLIAPVKNDLASIKKQIDVDFKKDAALHSEILAKLGFNNGATVSEMTQSELVALLITFKRNLTPQILAELTSKGMPAELPNRVVACTDAIDKANVTQETLKSSTREETDTIIKEINSLYEEIIGICKIASDHFKGNPVKKEMFTFSKILRNIGETRQVKTDPVEKEN
jgi:hypothetical protein